MACWQGLFCHGRAATIMRRLQYQTNYAVDVVKAFDRKKENLGALTPTGNFDEIDAYWQKDHLAMQ